MAKVVIGVVVALVGIIAVIAFMPPAQNAALPTRPPQASATVASRPVAPTPPAVAPPQAAAVPKPSPAPPSGSPPAASTTASGSPASEKPAAALEKDQSAEERRAEDKRHLQAWLAEAKANKDARARAAGEFAFAIGFSTGRRDVRSSAALARITGKKIEQPLPEQLDKTLEAIARVFPENDPYVRTERFKLGYRAGVEYGVKLEQQEAPAAAD